MENLPLSLSTRVWLSSLSLPALYIQGNLGYTPSTASFDHTEDVEEIGREEEFGKDHHEHLFIGDRAAKAPVSYCERAPAKLGLDYMVVSAEKGHIPARPPVSLQWSRAAGWRKGPGQEFDSKDIDWPMCPAITPGCHEHHPGKK